jgi:uncharacterized coiled-coil protein SlyX
MNTVMLVFALAAAVLAVFMAVLGWVNGLMFNNRLRGLENRLAMESRVMNLERRLAAQDENLQRLDTAIKGAKAGPTGRDPDSYRRVGP